MNVSQKQILTRSKAKLLINTKSDFNSTMTSSTVSADLPNEGNHPNKYNFHIPEFSGNSQNVQWFIDQLSELVKLNNYNDQAALYLFKSKLSGAALQFFQNSPQCRAIIKFEACEKLLEFFKVEDSSSADLAQFQAIVLLPSESIKNLAHRFDYSAHKAYNFITDENSLSRIKAMQFLSAIPLSLKEKILIENIKEYKQMVEKAHQIQTIQESLATSASSLVAAHSVVVPSVSSGSGQLSLISKQLEALTLTIQQLQSNCSICKQTHETIQCPMLQNSVQRSAQNNQQFHQQHGNSNCCVFCGLQGHIMLNCRKFKSMLRSV